MIKVNMKRILMLAMAITVCCTASAQQSANNPTGKLLGIYVHQHWSYNHPYAARTWTLDDWTGYLDGVKKLGYNSVLIWPMLETIPDPMTPSDEANLEKIAKVIDIAKNRYQLKVSIVFCPNVSPKSEIGRQYTFEKRPFFHTDDRVDPGDPVAFGKLMEWREKLFRPLANADGLFVIDSDPGGYPGSTNLEFAYILTAHRRMLDRLRPGIEIYYWAHFGWESYGKFYATGELVHGTAEEVQDAMKLIERQNIGPWGVASSGFGPSVGDAIGMSDRVLAFNYGAIEGEPSFPLTIYGTDNAYNGGRNGAERGVFGNVQSHCLQLPNTFAFARGAQGLPVERADYVAFANELIVGQGETIVEGWESLQSGDSKRMDKAAKRLRALTKRPLETGSLKGLLFGDVNRFIEDLAVQLDVMSSLQTFSNAVNRYPKSHKAVKIAFSAFVEAVETWQTRHGYSNHWYWPTMIEALKKLEAKPVDETLATLTWVSEEGDTPFERVKNGLARLEDYSPRLIKAMRQALAEWGK
ncbi:hypothetical protein GCM10011386_04120 [Parapedobacter defluvii]|uniref:Glycoside hydrolase family 5 domain-containing protein n=2 Tax=Parapedobacter defluvii TaxID=2045106 RepID=A0ABQ1L318_9SPHI|nr:hypothetical protein GCM10011386_04120 [Parapedobacter defluvii]